MIEADCFTMSERYVVTFRNATSRPPMRVENFSNLKITFKQAGVSWSPQVCELRLCERCFCVRRFRDAFFRLFFFLLSSWYHTHHLFVRLFCSICCRPTTA